MKTLILVLVLAAAAFSQGLDGFSYVARSQTNAYGIGNVRRTGLTVRFTGMLTPYHAVDGRIVVDPDNVIFTEFTGNCVSFEWYATKYYGLRGGKKVQGNENPKDVLTAEKGQIMFSALEMACREKKTTA